MLPTLTDVHVQVPLTQISIAYRQDRTQYIAAKAFPIVPVQKQADKYWSYPRDYWFRTEAEELLPASESQGSEYSVDSSAFYSARIYAVHKDIDDATRANTDSALNADRDATENVTDQMLLKREKIWAANYFIGSLWTGAPADQAGVSATPSTNQFLQWDLSGSTPIEDVQKQIVNVAELTGKLPNKFVVGPRTALALRNNPEIIDRVKYTQSGLLSDSIIAPAFTVEDLLVPYITQNTAAEGATLSMSLLYGKAALLFYAPPSAGLLTPSAGYTFAWQGYLNGTADIAIYRFRMQERHADRVEGMMAFDMKVVATDLGVYFGTASG